MPALQEWLANEQVQSDFKALARKRIMGSDTDDQETWTHLQQAYAAMTGEAEQLADGPIEVIVAVLVAGYLGSIAPQRCSTRACCLFLRPTQCAERNGPSCHRCRTG